MEPKGRTFKCVSIEYTAYTFELRTTSTSGHWSQTTTMFCLINVSGRLTYCRRQSVSCCSHSSVEQFSISRHRCPFSLHLPLSSYNHSSFLFVGPTVPAQWLVILNTTIAIVTF